MKAEAVLRVAVAVMQRRDGSVLLAQRLPGTPYAGYWEFPGGKLEPGESAHDALRRELGEELGIEVTRATPWLTQRYAYPHADVELAFFRVSAWRGEPHGRDGQAIAWQRPDDIRVEPLLPANGTVLQALRLPSVYAVSMAEELGEDAFIERLAVALDGGLKLIQLREKTMAERRFDAFASRVIALARPRGARVLVNADAATAARLSCDGVHWSIGAPRAGARATARHAVRGVVPRCRRARARGGARRRFRRARAGEANAIASRTTGSAAGMVALRGTGSSHIAARVCDRRTRAR